MRILLITETVPYPLDTGGRIKTWHTLRALARQHEVHCHAFVRDTAQRDAALGPLRGICQSVDLHLLPRRRSREIAYLARSLATGIPFTVVRHFDPAIGVRIADACRTHQVDAVYCDHLSMFEYGIRAGVPIVHDAHNVEHRIVRRYARHLGRLDPRRPLFSREWRRLLAYETTMYARAALIFTVSDIDRDDIARLAGPDVPVVPVPIPVDVSGTPAISELTDAPQVLFLGALDWPPNADAVTFFLAEVWPRVREQVPDASLRIVGRGEAALARQWAGTPGVQFTGRVPDIEPWIRQSRVMVVPIRSGSGMRVKILDAMARGLPVVATPVGYEGIEVTPGVHLLAADTAAAFAEATVRVLREKATAQALSRAARQLALERYDAGVVGARQLEALRTWLS
jgi:glycosyltransferase involved in cell wall biosynthesis